MIAVDMTKDVAPGMMITIKLSGVRKWKVRLWIAGLLFRLGAKVMNVGIEFKQ